VKEFAMDKTLVLTRLHQLTGELRPTPGQADDLGAFERDLAEQLIRNPALVIAGNRLPHEGSTQTEPVPDLAERFSHLDYLF